MPFFCIPCIAGEANFSKTEEKERETKDVVGPGTTKVSEVTTRYFKDCGKEDCKTSASYKPPETSSWKDYFTGSSK